MVYYTTLVIGLLTGLNTMSVQISLVIVSPGRGGFAVGFALRDVNSNFLSGV